MPPTDADRSAHLAARALLRRRTPHLLFPTYFLTPSRRHAVRALAAFLIITHDALNPKPSTGGDCCSSATNLAPLIREQIDRLYANSVELPLPEFRDESQRIVHAFHQTITRFEVSKHFLTDWIDGLLANQSTTRYATWRALERHCHQTHGPIARAVAAIVGITRSDAPPLLLDLAAGVRLTEILTAIPTDLAAGRIYIPLEDLTRHRYSERDLLAKTTSDNFRDLIRSLVERARDLLMKGQSLLPAFAGDGSRVATAALLVQYTDVLRKIERRRFDVFTSAPPSPRASLSRLPTIWRLARLPSSAAASSPSPSRR